ncbi:BNR-4 repeat-containing protein [Amycolatopsis sp. H20-H5]|uniref:BNR-4 repeat-containing protein n=1 Tax=Amycolatopsis sp. H20-H5 TaxID=3046309 RepID=UPI002DBFBB58|nr:BNR-4 repeat-containing protein [Amycolatopsis sp. H20-H5]MEC3980173.1 BNR-4 repeat-containing protein [Amycolatopsis sp. H20-H5]
MRRALRALIPLTAAGLLISAAPALAAHRAPGFSVTTTASSVASRSDRRPDAGGLYDAASNKTFISWSGQAADTYVQAYDHRTGAWTAPKRIAAGESGSHNYPTMVEAADGHLLIIRGMHNTRTVISRAPRAHSLDGTWTETEVAAGDAASYPMPVKLADGTLYVFYRETTNQVDPAANTDFRPMKYIVSKDSGKTWQNSVQLTGKPRAFGSSGRADHLDEIYVGQLRYQRETGRIQFVYTLAGGGPDQHKHDVYHRDVYYLSFDPRSLHFFSAAGRDLGTQVDDQEQEQYLKVADTPIELPGGVKSPDYILQVGSQSDGKPFVTWFQFDTAGAPHDHAAAWTGRKWESREVATGLRLREIEPLGHNVWRVYATRDGLPDIETYLLTGGRVWKAESVIKTPKPVQRVEVITGFRDPARILASGASTARDVSVADGDIYVAGVER